MPAYPDIPTKTEAITPLGGVINDLSDGGDLFFQDLGDGQTFEIKLVHPYVSLIENQTLDAFYDANRTTLVTTPSLSDGNTYDGVMTRPELVEEDGVFRTLRVTIHGTRN